MGELDKNCQIVHLDENRQVLGIGRKLSNLCGLAESRQRTSWPKLVSYQLIEVDVWPKIENISYQCAKSGLLAAKAKRKHQLPEARRWAKFAVGAVGRQTCKPTDDRQTDKRADRRKRGLFSYPDCGFLVDVELCFSKYPKILVFTGDRAIFKAPSS